jgi:hypothetical protein
VNQARPFDRRVEPLRTERVAMAKAALAGRLRRVCSHLSASEFDALLERMVLLDIKYAQRANEHLLGLRDAIDASRKPKSPA